MKGQSACPKFLLSRNALEAAILKLVQDRLRALECGEGERVLRYYVEHEITAQWADPGREVATIRSPIEEIDRKADLRGITIARDDARLDVQIRQIPALGPGFTCLTGC